MANLNQYQIAFYLSWISNYTSFYMVDDTVTDSGERASLLEEQMVLVLSSFMDTSHAVSLVAAGTAIPTINSDVVNDIGSWELVWGPAVYVENNSYVATNTMFVAKTTNGENSTYVVAMAGTNPFSMDDWLSQDLLIDTKFYSFPDLQPSTSADSEKAYISQATFNGLNSLLNLVDPISNNRLTNFITANQNQSASNIVFVGHSLGGALSPALALYCKEEKFLNQYAKAYVYPSAGPTPGNDAFAAMFDFDFPANPDSTGDQNVWNTNIKNALDIVPHAWGLATLPQLYTIYGNAPTDVKGEIDAAIAVSTDASTDPKHMIYTHIRSYESTTKFSGPAPSDSGDFYKIAGNEHTNAYQGGYGSNTPDSGIILANPVPRFDAPLVNHVTKQQIS